MVVKMVNCQICKEELIEGNPGNIYGTDEGLKHRSNHHLFPKRFEGYFTNDEIQKIFQIDNPSCVIALCYECHEEVLHNIILNELMLEGLSELLVKKNKTTKMKILHEILKKGIESCLEIENKKNNR
ncbi:MAG: hypothetical protein Q7U60_02590 [Candidatus Methanoperedens sp.]|nr:hypothetical protein [Candidatus Methanoperedens sp.]